MHHTLIHYFLTNSCTEKHGGVVEVVHEAVHHHPEVTHPERPVFLRKINCPSRLMMMVREAVKEERCLGIECNGIELQNETKISFLFKRLRFNHSFPWLSTLKRPTQRSQLDFGEIPIFGTPCMNKMREFLGITMVSPYRRFG